MGRKYTVLKGTSPAWSNNAGKFIQKILSEILEDKPLAVEEPMAKYQINAKKASLFIFTLAFWCSLT